METAAASLPSAAQDSPIFGRILCGIDGSRAAVEAATQATTLAMPGSRVEFIAMPWESGYGPNAQALLTRARAEEALRAAKKLAQRAGVDVITTIHPARSVARALLEEAHNHDLLVLGSHGNSRTGGIMVGSTVSTVVHKAHLPILVARAAPSDVPFPTRVLVGADGPGAPESAIRIAAQLGRAWGSQVTLVRVGGWTHEHRRGIAEAAVELAEATACEPVELITAGEPHRQLVELAERERASLIIVGSRGLAGVHALTSTSERVAHEASCSVLVMRPL